MTGGPHAGCPWSERGPGVVQTPAWRAVRQWYERSASRPLLIPVQRFVGEAAAFDLGDIQAHSVFYTQSALRKISDEARLLASRDAQCVIQDQHLPAAACARADAYDRNAERRSQFSRQL